jgi:hypothetical protein
MVWLMSGAQKVFYFGDTVLIDCVIVHFSFPWLMAVLGRVIY